MDEGSCGPRGDDAQADLSQCVNGADVVYSEPFEGYTPKATVNGCNYYSFDVYACLEGAGDMILSLLLKKFQA